MYVLDTNIYLDFWKRGLGQDIVARPGVGLSAIVLAELGRIGAVFQGDERDPVHSILALDYALGQACMNLARVQRYPSAQVTRRRGEP